MHRSDDGGKTWRTVGNEFAYKGETGTHQRHDGTDHPWEFKRVGTGTVARRPKHGLRRRGGRGHLPLQRRRGDVAEIPGRRHETPAASGRRAAVVSVSIPSFSILPTPDRIYIAISSAGAFRTDDGGVHVEADQSWPESNYIPDEAAQVVIASTTLPCTRRWPWACCSCKSTGM